MGVSTMGRSRLMRFAAVLGLSCALHWTVVDPLSSLGSARAALAAQPTDVPYGVAVADAPTYSCPAGRSVTDTIAACEQTQKHKTNVLWIIAVAAAVALLVYLIARNTRFSTGRKPPLNEQLLLEDGPQLPVQYPDGSLTIAGFARDGWPVVVDFEPQPGTVTSLDVTVGRRKFQQVLDPDGRGGRQLVKIQLPDNLTAPVARPATYMVSSAAIADFDVEQPKAVSQVPLKIYGIGGGPNAVGSVAIEQVAFGGLPTGAAFRYRAKSNFTAIKTAVQRFHKEGSINKVETVSTARLSNILAGPRGGQWDGRVIPSGVTSTGLHRFQVTGWFTTDDRSWVAAIAPDLVSK